MGNFNVLQIWKKKKSHKEKRTAVRNATLKTGAGGEIYILTSHLESQRERERKQPGAGRARPADFL